MRASSFFDRARRRLLMATVALAAGAGAAAFSASWWGVSPTFSTRDTWIASGLQGAASLDSSSVFITKVEGWTLKLEHWRSSGERVSYQTFDLRDLTLAAGAKGGEAQGPTPSSLQQPAVTRSSAQRQPPSWAASSSVAVSTDAQQVAWISRGELYVMILGERYGHNERIVESIRRVRVSEPDATPCGVVIARKTSVVGCPDGRLMVETLHGVRDIATQSADIRLLSSGDNVLAVFGTNAYLVDSERGPSLISGAFSATPRAFARATDGRLAFAFDDGTITIEPHRSEPADKHQTLRTLTAPGAVDTLAFVNGHHLIVGGAFRGVHLLDDQGASQPLVPDVVGTRTLVADAHDRFAYASVERTAIATILYGTAVNRRGQVLWMIAVICLVGGGGTLALVVAPSRWRQALLALARKIVSDDAAPEHQDPSFAASEPLPVLRLPEPPAGLIEACGRGECVLYAGAGLSAQAGYPTWPPFVEELLKWGLETGAVEAAFGHSMRASLRQGQADLVADVLVSSIGKAAVVARLAETFTTRRGALPDVHRLLKRIPLGAALTTNFDDLLERTYPEAAGRVVTPGEAERMLEMLGRREFFIGKLYGSVADPESVLVAPAEYVEAVSRNLTFSQAMEGLFVSRTLLFVGASLEGIEAYLSGLTFRGQMTRPHYALVAVTHAGWRAKADLLHRRYGIEVLPYTPTDGFPEVPAFLTQLAETVAPHVAGSVERAPGEDARGVRRLHLQNIGPFHELSLDLQSDWNVVLGDNGVGKSSILRAIAACFCGKDVEPYAARLVRAGEPSGTIVLETAHNTYRMELRRRDGGAEVSIVPKRPLEVEGCLALGFPPLRSVSWDRPKGPTSEGRRRPTTEDLLPVVTSTPDPRLDRLKQWIVNVDARIHYEKTRGSDDRYERLLDRFYEIVDRVTPGMNIRRGNVNQDTKEVTVVTDDGEIPIELVSQGSISLMGWVGVLLQRLYEIYGEDADPTQRYALVLIDEIDAHMHPEWQQSVVDVMSDLFPHVQFLATTHSPLVVAGMQARQVVRFARNAEGETVRVDVTDEMLVGRADQILTGRLFGMKTTLDPQTQRTMGRYKELLAIPRRSSEQEIEFQRLHRDLKFKVPVAEETAPERKAFALVEAIVNDQIGQSVPEARKPLLDKARALLDEIVASETRAV